MTKRNSKKVQNVVEAVEVAQVELTPELASQVDAEIADILSDTAIVTSEESTPAEVSQAVTRLVERELEQNPEIATRQSEADAIVDAHQTPALSVSERVEAIRNDLSARCARVVAIVEEKKASTDAFVANYKALNNERLITALVTQFNIASDFFRFVDSMKAYDSRNVNEYQAVKAVKKVEEIAYAVTGINSSKIDSYTRAIITNARNTPGQEIRYDLAFASLTQSVKVSETDKLKVQLCKAASTAGTQRSSTKSALLALKLATYDAQTDKMHLRDCEMMNALIQNAF